MAGRPFAGAPAVRGKAEATHLTVRRTGGTPRGGPGPGDPCLPGHAGHQGVVAPAQLRTLTFSPALPSGAAPPRPTQGRGGESQPEGDWEPFQAPLDTRTPKSSASPLFPHPTPPLPLLGNPGILRPGLLSLLLPRPKRPSPALPVLRLRRPAPCAEMGFPLSDALATPRYLFLGSPGAQAPRGLPGGRAGPPLSQARAGGGAAPPRGAVGFSNTNTAPPAPQPRPLPRGPAPSRAGVPLSGPAPPSAGPTRLSAGAQKDAGCGVPGSGCNVLGPAPSPA